MGRIFRKYLEGTKIYSCGSCGTHITTHEAILSKQFRGRTGKAYLFDFAVNVSLGPLENRELTTGLHTVGDIFCNSCRSVVGWKYEEAFEESQKYKEGKFILEIAKMKKEWILNASSGTGVRYVD